MHLSLHRVGTQTSASQTKTTPTAQIVKKSRRTNQQRRGKAGQAPKLDLEKKVTLFLFTRLLSKSNRGMEEALELLEHFIGFAARYKFIDRLYSDAEVKLALHTYSFYCSKKREPQVIWQAMELDIP